MVQRGKNSLQYGQLWLNHESNMLYWKSENHHKAQIKIFSLVLCYFMLLNQYQLVSLPGQHDVIICHIC